MIDVNGSAWIEYIRSIYLGMEEGVKRPFQIAQENGWTDEEISAAAASWDPMNLDADTYSLFQRFIQILEIKEIMRAKEYVVGTRRMANFASA